MEVTKQCTEAKKVLEPFQARLGRLRGSLYLGSDDPKVLEDWHFHAFR